MQFQPINLNNFTTFICQAQVSEKSVEQAIRVYDSLIANPGITGTGVNKEKKHSFDVTIVPNQCLSIQSEVEAIKNIYIDYYSLQQHIPKLFMTELFNIQKYPVNGAFHAIHADRGYNNDRYRELVWMTYLNDVYDGGETEFMFYNLKIKPRKGLTLIWPAGWTHMHRGLPSEKSEKMIVTGWFSPK